MSLLYWKSYVNHKSSREMPADLPDPAPANPETTTGKVASGYRSGASARVRARAPRAPRMELCRMNQTSTDQSPPLVVKPREAARLLSLCPSSVYGLMRAGELESFRDGRSRRITMKSIEKYLARQLSAARDYEWGRRPHKPRNLEKLTAADGWEPWPHNPRAHRKQVSKPRKRARKEAAA
jgi:excisionase family DNA binding protein